MATTLRLMLSKPPSASLNEIPSKRRTFQEQSPPTKHAGLCSLTCSEEVFPRASIASSARGFGAETHAWSAKGAFGRMVALTSECGIHPDTGSDWPQENRPGHQ